METQSDLEVILEFLEEYYQQSSLKDVEEVCVLPKSLPMAITCETCCEANQGPSKSQDGTSTLNQSLRKLPEYGSLPNSVVRQSSKKNPRSAGSGRKVRLFHFLFEMLENPGMAHCVSWVPAATGVFHFSSRNKDQVAALWGQRKGNKTPMTYQKMSRALRNYAHSGEIVKVKKKLTYQFSRETLNALTKQRKF